MSRKKYLLEITRTERQERPDESTISSDSNALNTADFANVAQDLAKDTYVNFWSRNLQLDLVRLVTIQEFNPAKIQAGNGFRVLEYPHSDKYKSDPALREGAHVELHIQNNVSSERQSMNTVSEASNVVATLHPSDGYYMLDELPGTRTQVIESRPSLWKNTEVDNQTYMPIIGQPNVMGRIEEDRY